MTIRFLSRLIIISKETVSDKLFSCVRLCTDFQINTKVSRLLDIFVAEAIRVQLGIAKQTDSWITDKVARK